MFHNRNVSIVLVVAVFAAAAIAQRVTVLSTAPAQSDSPVLSYSARAGLQIAWRRYTQSDGNWLEMWDSPNQTVRSINPGAGSDARLVGFVAPGEVLVRFAASLYVYSFSTYLGTRIETAVGGDQVHADGTHAVWVRNSAVVLYDGATRTSQQISPSDGSVNLDPFVEGNWASWTRILGGYHFIMRYDIGSHGLVSAVNGTMESPVAPVVDEAGRVLYREHDLNGNVGTGLYPGNVRISGNDGQSMFNRAYAMHAGEIAHLFTPMMAPSGVWLDEVGFPRRTIATSAVGSGFGNVEARSGMVGWFNSGSVGLDLQVHDGKDVLRFPTTLAPASGVYPGQHLRLGHIAYLDSASNPPGLVTWYQSKMSWGADELSARSGYDIGLTLWTGSQYAGHVYVVLASASGSYPGTPIGATTLPINFDGLTQLALVAANLSPAFGGFVGFVGQLGGAGADFQPPPGMLQPLVGSYLTFVFVVLDPASGAIEVVSNPARLKITP